jgi:hypothetical protein
VAIGRTVITQGPTRYMPREGVGSDGATGSRLSAARALVRSLGMVALATFGILVLLPAVLAVQAALAF